MNPNDEYREVTRAADDLRARVDDLHAELEEENRLRDARIRWTHRAIAASAFVGLLGIGLAATGWWLNGQRVDDILAARAESRASYCRALDAVATVQTEIDQILQVSISAPRQRTPEEQALYDRFVALVGAQRQAVAEALAAARVPSCQGEEK